MLTRFILYGLIETTFSLCTLLVRCVRFDKPEKLGEEGKVTHPYCFHSAVRGVGHTQVGDASCNFPERDFFFLEKKNMFLRSRNNCSSAGCCQGHRMRSPSACANTVRSTNSCTLRWVEVPTGFVLRSRGVDALSDDQGRTRKVGSILDSRDSGTHAGCRMPRQPLVKTQEQLKASFHHP
jgi:hypothetical protein